MNKTAIKNFAIWARTRLIEDIKYKASLLGITEKGIANPLPQSTSAEQYYDIGTKEPNVITGKQITQRRSLVEAINTKAKEVDYKVAYNSIMEAVAYTWFNRLIAVRFMEVNDYLPCKIRVLSAEDGRQEPDIVRMPLDARLDYSDAEVNLIRNYQLNNASDELFQMLFIKVCNDLSVVLPQLFEKQDDYTELLLNISYTNQDGLVYKLVNDIPQGDFDVEQGGQVEIIGWLYQYYISERHDEVIDSLYGRIISKEDVPAATQLFTPDWIVKYLVDNSLGRYWIERNSNSLLLKKLDYFIPSQNGFVGYTDEIVNPEELTVFDPCVGSGHFLVYAFDVLMEIYRECGYTEKDAVISILENNLYGLDIDDRAYQLAYFAVLMKARQYHKFILKKRVNHHIHVIVESNGIKLSQLQYFGASLDEFSKNAALTQIYGLIDKFKDAQEYGSILVVENFDWKLLRRFVMDFDIENEPNLFSTFGIEKTRNRLMHLVDVGECLSKKYDVCVTNPPYLNKMDSKLKEFARNNYKDYASDLFSIFIYRNFGFCKENGYSGLLTPNVWMFISSYEKLRNHILKNKYIVNFVQLAKGAFFKIATVDVCAFVFKNKYSDESGTYIRLENFKGDMDIQKKYLLLAKNSENANYKYYTEQKNFFKIPGYPIAFWINNKIIECFSNLKINDITISDGQTKTGDNDKYIRLFWEIDFNRFGKNQKWVKHPKGGGFRRWYGNLYAVVDWDNKAREHYRRDRVARILPEYLWWRKGISWNLITSGKQSFRNYSDDEIFNLAAPTLFFKEERERVYCLGLLNSKVAEYLIALLNPTLNCNIGDIQAIPFIYNSDDVNKIVIDNITYVKKDWDAFENSWDFVKHPLVPTHQELQEQQISQFANTRMEKFSRLDWHYKNWENDCKYRFDTLKANEEELNRIFIEIYGLQDELTPEVEDEEIGKTIRKADLQRDIKSLLSYAVGCMFGRYSLDAEGLAYAGGEWDANKYSTFIPDEDNVIPITDEDYFEDDIVGRFVEWLKAVYGDDSLEENLRFIANALGTSGDTPRRCIRNYFLKDFYKDHCKIYQKRPIYWLYDSGKQNGFKALIYMHRYNEDTTGKMRVDYLARMEETYESEINREQNVVDNGVPREAAKAAKRIEKLKKQLKECRDYDVNIGHIALSRIAIDLDDGVKVNYEKVQTGKDGTVLPILAKI